MCPAAEAGSLEAPAPACIFATKDLSQVQEAESPSRPASLHRGTSAAAAVPATAPTRGLQRAPSCRYMLRSQSMEVVRRQHGVQPTYGRRLY